MKVSLKPVQDYADMCGYKVECLSDLFLDNEWRPVNKQVDETFIAEAIQNGVEIFSFGMRDGNDVLITFDFSAKELQV